MWASRWMLPDKIAAMQRLNHSHQISRHSFTKVNDNEPDTDETHLSYALWHLGINILIQLLGVMRLRV